MNEKDISLDTAFRLTKVASLSVNDEDVLFVVRHYSGSGASIKTIETYVIRKGKFLGRFQTEERLAYDAVWTCEYPDTTDLTAIRKARMLMLGLVEKVWT